MATKKTPAKAQAKKSAQRQIAYVTKTEFFQPNFWGQHLLPSLALMALAFVLYGITLGYGYLQDDQLFIWDNSFAQKGFAGLAEIFGNDSLLGYYKDPNLMLEGGRYRPLPLATFAIEIGLFGKDSPGVAHFFNVLLYGFTGVFIYRILLGLFPNREGAIYWGLPFLAAVFFTVHPLHVEVVANIKSRDEILALLGSLGALWATMQYFDTQDNRWRWIAAGCLFLGLLSKENTATFLAVIPLTLWMFSKLPLGRILTACLPMLAAVFLFLVMRAFALGKAIPHPDELVLNPFLGMTGLERSATILLSMGWYVKLLFIPHPLTIDYYPYHVPKMSWTDWRVLITAAAYLIVGAWAFQKARSFRSRHVEEGTGWLIPAYCVLYFFLTISVVSNVFVRTSTFLNERYLYMPSIAFCILAAWFIARKLPDMLGKMRDVPNLWSIVLAGTIVILFGMRSWTRIPDWGGDGTGLVESAVKVSSGSYRANYYYANLLYQNKYLKIEKASDASAVSEKNALIDSIDFYLDRSLEINPGYRLAAPLKIQMALGRFNQTKDLEKLLLSLEKLIQAQPSNGEMLNMVAEILKSLKGADPNIYNYFCHRVGYNFYYVKKHDPDGAVFFLNFALENFPQDKNTMQDLIQIYSSTGN
ncbi:MAG: hypothetical protein ACKVT2_21700, partial [Saprospiraceae bacterium]